MQGSVKIAPAILLGFLSVLGIIFLLSGRFLVGGVLLAVGIILLLSSLRRIPYRPPHVGVVTIWGRRIPIVLSEGWHLLAPYPPFMYSATLMNVERKNKDFLPTDVRSKEKVELQVEVSITWMPDKENGENLITYLDTGGKERVEDILEDIVEERCREFAIGIGWEDALAANIEIAQLLIKEIAGVEEGIEITAIRRGNGVAQVKSLGIILNRLNIGSIWIKGEMAKQAERPAIEIRQREAEATELAHVRGQMRGFQDQGLSAKDAVEVVQTERGKVRKDIREYKLGGLEEIAREVIRALRER